MAPSPYLHHSSHSPYTSSYTQAVILSEATRSQPTIADTGQRCLATQQALHTLQVHCSSAYLKTCQKYMDEADKLFGSCSLHSKTHIHARSAPFVQQSKVNSLKVPCLIAFPFYDPSIELTCPGQNTALFSTDSGHTCSCSFV